MLHQPWSPHSQRPHDKRQVEASVNLKIISSIGRRSDLAIPSLPVDRSEQCNHTLRADFRGVVRGKVASPQMNRMASQDLISLDRRMCIPSALLQPFSRRPAGSAIELSGHM